ncbi:MAG TPA: ABC transporter substrate-binding protein [Thermomicrobiales bacterium]|nr:ABC transporter substrate-binding protein [Thermomicrobiales bacterium]
MAGSLSRRRFIATSALLAGLSGRQTLARQATPSSDAAASVQPDGTWQFTDDRGTAITRDALPTRVIAQTTSAAGLWDFGVRPVGIFGPYRDPDGSPNPAVGSMDLDQVAWLGDFGELDFEQIIALDAEIYVDINRGVGPLWYVDESIQPRLEELVDTISIDAIDTTVKRAVERFEDLAVALGAELSAPEIVEAKETFARLESDLRTVAAEKSDVRVLVLTGDPATNAYFVNPEVTFDLLYYRELGVNLIQPETPDPSTGGNFEVVSWEQLGKYPADVVLYDNRSDITLLDGDPIWELLPAVRAGQTGPWPVTFPLSWQGLGGAMELLLETLANAEVVR